MTGDFIPTCSSNRTDAEGAVSNMSLGQERTEAEEGAVSYTTLTRNKMDSLILKDNR